MNYNFSILHPTDFSEASQLAFVHALKLALTCGTKLTILRFNTKNLPKDSKNYPPVRETLERWGYLPKGSGRAAVYNKLRLKVEKINMNNSNPHRSIIRYIERQDIDLTVLSVQSQIIYPNSISYNVFRFLSKTTQDQFLFIPNRSRGFVSYYDGSISLKNILIPVIQNFDPTSAIKEAVSLIKALGCGEEKITFIYTGDMEWWPEGGFPEFSSCQWAHIHIKESAIDQIIALSYKMPADLIITTTRGKKGFGNSNQQDITEDLLQNASCPILTIVDS